MENLSILGKTPIVPAAPGGNNVSGASEKCLRMLGPDGGTFRLGAGGPAWSEPGPKSSRERPEAGHPWECLFSPSGWATCKGWTRHVCCVDGPSPLDLKQAGASPEVLGGVPCLSSARMPPGLRYMATHGWISR